MSADFTQDRKCYMYLITNKINGHDYVGVTVNYKSRWAGHKRDARKGLKRKFANALASYGIDNFEWKVIAIFRNEKIARDAERIARKFLGLGYYNMTDGGDGLLNPSEETRRKIGEANKGTKWSPEARQRMSEQRKGHAPYNKGMKHSEETRRKISQSNTGKKRPRTEAHQAAINASLNSPDVKAKLREARAKLEYTPEIRAKLSEGQLRRAPPTEETRQKMRNNRTGRKAPDHEVEAMKAAQQKRRTREAEDSYARNSKFIRINLLPR